MTTSAIDAFRRQIILLQRLTESPASKQELIRYIESLNGPDAFGRDSGQSLTRDINALNDRYHCAIVRKGKGKYVLEGLGDFGLISLNENELETLAQLRALYPKPKSSKRKVAALPLEQRVGRFLEHLVRHLDDSTRQKLMDIPAGLRAVGGQVEHRPQTEETLRQLEQYRAKKKIQFDYGSLFTAADGITVCHVVHPFDLIFRDGHFYLVGFMETNDRDPNFREQWVDYRLDRIVLQSIKSLDEPVMNRPPRPVRTVIYHLHADIAGRQDFKVALDGDVSIERQADRSAIVTVQTTMSTFLIRQALLRYGSRCRVLGPPELVQEMRRVAHEMGDLYEDEPFAGWAM